MPVFIGALLGGITSALASWVGRVLVTLGIGYTTYTGFSVLLDWMKSNVQSNVTALPPMVQSIAGAMKLDICVSILFSAVTVRLLIMGVNNGAFTKVRIKQP